MPLPPPVSVDLLSGAPNDYWRARVEQHFHDTYAGVQMTKFPEDLRTYEHLLWESAANVVIEFGSYGGGSVLWFRDRLEAMVRHGRIRDPLVISVDIDAAATRANVRDQGGVEILEADLLDPGLPARIRALLPDGARPFIVEDSAHEYATTRAALEGFADLVPVGGFFVVEDGCVDVEPLRLDPSWPRGVLPALRDWLATAPGRRFAVRRDLEIYGLSCHPGGFLQRVA